MKIVQIGCRALKSHSGVTCDSPHRKFACRGLRTTKCRYTGTLWYGTVSQYACYAFSTIGRGTGPRGSTVAIIDSHTNFYGPVFVGLENLCTFLSE